MTCALAAAVSRAPLLYDASFAVAWLKSWLTSWAAILPVVLFAAPLIRRIVDRLQAIDAALNEADERGPLPGSSRHK